MNKDHIAEYIRDILFASLSKLLLSLKTYSNMLESIVPSISLIYINVCIHLYIHLSLSLSLHELIFIDM